MIWYILDHRLTAFWSVFCRGRYSSCRSHSAGPRLPRWRTEPLPASRWTGGRLPWLPPHHTARSEATHGTSWTRSRSPIYPPAETCRKQTQRCFTFRTSVFLTECRPKAFMTIKGEIICIFHAHSAIFNYVTFSYDKIIIYIKHSLKKKFDFAI